MSLHIAVHILVVRLLGFLVLIFANSFSEEGIEDAIVFFVVGNGAIISAHGLFQGRNHEYLYQCSDALFFLHRPGIKDGGLVT